MEGTGTAYKGRSSLTLRLDRKAFSFSLYDPASVEGFRFVPHAINPLISMVANMKEALGKEPLLKDAYGQVNILLTGGTTLVPAALFNEEDVVDFYRLQYPGSDNYEVLYNRLPHVQAVLLFPVERGLRQLLLDEYPEAAFCSILSSVTEHFCGLSRFGNNAKLYLYFHDGKVCMEVFDRGRLKFMNEFDIENQVDNILYYTACVWKSCGLDVEHDRLFMTGDPGGLKDTLLAQLRRFYRNVFYINPASEFNEASVSRVDHVPYDVQSLLVYGI